jgi:hypothetical protein
MCIASRAQLSISKYLLFLKRLYVTWTLHVYLHYAPKSSTLFTLYNVDWLLMWMMTNKYMSVIL